MVVKLWEARRTGFLPALRTRPPPEIRADPIGRETVASAAVGGERRFYTCG
jgi:hypothetical protein